MPVFHDHLEQGSASWLAFRKDKITATDIATICGVNPYKSPFMLWQEKLGLLESTPENEAMREGKRLEPIALEKLNSEMGYKCVPVVVTHSDNPNFMASIDGWDGRAVEIKCGTRSFQQSKEMIVPIYYQYQMQWQMYILEIGCILYYCFDGVNDNSFIVMRDQELINDMIVKANEFLEMLRTITPPPYTDLDYDDKTDDEHWNSLMASYALYDQMEKDGKLGKEHVKYCLIEAANGRNVKGNRSKFTKVITKGRVQYDKIEALKDIDLEQYRGEDVTSFRITLNKD